MKLSTVVIITLIVLLVVACLPVFKVVVVPQWPIKVVDISGQLVSNFEVRQHWNHYSFDGSGIDSPYGGEEDLRSNASGDIIFPERSFHASFLRIAFAKIGSPLRWINVHASTGESSYFICLSGSCSYESEPHYRGNAAELEKNTLVVTHMNSENGSVDDPVGSTSDIDTGTGTGTGANYDDPPPPGNHKAESNE